MTQHLNDEGLLFSPSEDQGFELPTSPGVTVTLLLLIERGDAIDVFYLSVEAGAEVTRERHPFSETLLVLKGRVACSIEDAEPVEVGAGQMWHNLPDRHHDVRNVGHGQAEIAMLIGI